MTVTELIKDRIKHLDVQIKDPEQDYGIAISSYCGEVKSNTPLVNVFNVVNHAAETKKLKYAKEELERILWLIEMKEKTT